MDQVAIPGAVEPSQWMVVFHPTSSLRWASFLACGRFKHVSAWGYYAGFKAWIIFDPQWASLRLTMISHERAVDAFVAATEGCVILKIERSDRDTALAPLSRFGFYCVPAIKHLLGVRCAAWRPDALYRHLLRKGGMPINGQNTADSGRSEPSD